MSWFAILLALASLGAMPSKPLSQKFADIRIRPGDKCSVTLGGKLVITGMVETRQVAYTAEGGVAFRGDFKAQARGAFEAIKALVESQGGAMANIVKITTYVTDMRYRADLAPIREEFLGRKGPASTLVEISQLAHPDWMIEIEAVAVL